MIEQPITELTDALQLKPTETQPSDAVGEVLPDFIPVDKLVIDRSFQRKVSERSRSRILKIANNFSWSQFGAIIVSRTHDSRYSVIDGQHRAIAATHIGQVMVPAVVVAGDTRKQALDFVGINTNRTSVATIDKFRARVTAGEPDAVELAKILADLQIDTDVAAGGNMKPRQTRSISALQKLVKTIGKGLTFTTLEMMLDAQPDNPTLLTNMNIQATAKCLVRITDSGGDLDRLAKQLEETDFESLSDDAAQMVKLTGGNRMDRAAELMMRSYNKRLQNKVA